MGYSMTVVFLLLFAVPASALQIGDGYNNDTYNGHAYGQSDRSFLNMSAKGGGGVPIGSIIAWPVTTDPEDMENWLECNGQAVNAAMYPELRAVIGPNVPDLRGLFLRGVGGNSATLGVKQDDAARINDMKVDIMFDGYSRSLAGHLGKNAYVPRWFGESGKYNMEYNKAKIRSDASVTETRPVNMAVRYFIRAQ